MKKVLFVFTILAALTACNSGDGNNSDSGSNSSATDSNASDGIGTGPRSTDEDTAARNIHTIENVNGNMPDTTNSINIGPEAGANAGDSAKQ